MTCFYPWKGCPSHKVLNPRMPEKRERTGYKLRNGSRSQTARRPRPFENAFVFLSFCLARSAFSLEEEPPPDGEGTGEGARPFPAPDWMSRGGDDGALRDLPVLEELPERHGKLAGDGDNRHLPHSAAGDAVLRPLAEPP